MPLSVAVSLIVIFLVQQIIGELLEVKGKIVPEFMKIRKYFDRKKKEHELMVDVHNTLQDIKSHYSKDNIAKRNDWMKWVNDRTVVYDKSIDEIAKNLSAVTEALKDNTRLTEKMFIQNSRDRIIDFATKVADDNVPVSREEFNRIFKVHDEYDAFLKERNLTNGEVDINQRIINEAYEKRARDHSFIENMRGYDN